MLRGSEYGDRGT
ncbi:Protein of unknown function [Bacillus mycoides]|nr:Protein of unknown function [Bacillus mycoides]